MEILTAITMVVIVNTRLQKRKNFTWGWVRLSIDLKKSQISPCLT